MLLRQNCNLDIQNFLVNAFISDSLPIDDVNFLRIIHLLFRMALPVLKMKLNNEIKPYQLRKTLDDKRSEMETLYRENETIINDNQWDLLYNPVKGTH